jgi:hypothetical protein
MKLMKLSTTVLALFIAAGVAPAYAGFKLPSLPSVPSANGGSSANAAEVTKNMRNALYSFATAELGLVQALGGYNDLAAQQQMLAGMKIGDAAATKDDIATLVNIDKSASAQIAKKTDDNAKLDADSKATARKATVEYIKGLVATRNTIASLQGVAKNPMALGSDAGTVLYAVKEIPGLISNGASTTSKLFSYLGANGVDVSAMKKDADGMGK